MARKRNLNSEIVVSAGPAAAAPARRVPARRPRSTKPAIAVADANANPSAPYAEIAAGAPSPDEVAALAYSYWEQRGCQGGSPEEDWARAESELGERVSAILA